MEIQEDSFKPIETCSILKVDKEESSKITFQSFKQSKSKYPVELLRLNNPEFFEKIRLISQEDIKETEDQNHVYLWGYRMSILKLKKDDKNLKIIKATKTSYNVSKMFLTRRYIFIDAESASKFIFDKNLRVVFKNYQNRENHRQRFFHDKVKNRNIFILVLKEFPYGAYSISKRLSRNSMNTRLKVIVKGFTPLHRADKRIFTVVDEEKYISEIFRFIQRNKRGEKKFK